ncbi:MAG: hypothetical protein IJ737_02975 [Ruminococcus sp.]|nr:hypothetical protein [Ruminococcus sp.]
MRIFNVLKILSLLITVMFVFVVISCYSDLQRARDSDAELIEANGDMLPREEAFETIHNTLLGGAVLIVLFGSISAVCFYFDKKQKQRIIEKAAREMMMEMGYYPYPDQDGYPQQAYPPQDLPQQYDQPSGYYDDRPRYY